jgi:hypothetical protein
LPLGAIKQKIRVRLNLPDEPVVEIPIEGNVEDVISVVGENWDDEHGMLTLGVVSGKTGIKAQLFLTVRGKNRDEVSFSLDQATPSALKVSFGEPKRQRSFTKVPLTIEISKGTPSMNHLGSQQGKLGQIFIATTHPQAKSLRLLVRFAVAH